MLRSGGWNTHNECQFIDGLVSLKWATTENKKTPEEFLEGYIRHAIKRIEWDTWGNDVNAQKVVKYAREALRRLNGTVESEKD